MHTLTPLFAVLRGLLLCEDGPTATEYAVMLALVIFVMLTAIAAVGNHVSGLFSTAANAGW
jgi:pilus assembly protein Flp/PilA